MATYLDYATFRGLTTIPESFVDDVEKRQPGWVEIQLEHGARWIDARLRKQYASPFAAFGDDPPTPPAVQGWLARIVTLRVMIRRGVDSNDEQFGIVKDDADAAMLEVLEAANSENGWFDLPLRVDEDGSARRTSSPRSYSEQSPYVYTDTQRDTGRNEDDSGFGSGG